VLPLQPTKANGYVQVSWRGVNKVVVLQELALWANDPVVEKGQGASHLCQVFKFVSHHFRGSHL
jgi:hypothetical protein